MIVGGAMIFLGIVTPLPWFIFIPMGIAIIVVSRTIGTKQAVEAIEGEAGQEGGCTEESSAADPLCAPRQS